MSPHDYQEEMEGGETISATERIWNIYVYTDPAVSLLPSQCKQGRCGLDTSRLLSVVT